MKNAIPLLFSLLLLLAGCGGGGGGSGLPPSGYLADLISSPIWNESSRIFTFFFYCTPPPNVTITSLEGEFSGPASGKINISYDPSTKSGQGTALLPLDGEYKIKIYAKDSSGRTTLVLQFSFTAFSSTGGGGGPGDDTPPPPPF